MPTRLDSDCTTGAPLKGLDDPRQAAAFDRMNCKAAAIWSEDEENVCPPGKGRHRRGGGYAPAAYYKGKMRAAPPRIRRTPAEEEEDEDEGDSCVELEVNRGGGFRPPKLGSPVGLRVRLGFSLKESLVVVVSTSFALLSLDTKLHTPVSASIRSLVLIVNSAFCILYPPIASPLLPLSRL